MYLRIQIKTLLLHKLKLHNVMCKAKCPKCNAEINGNEDHCPECNAILGYEEWQCKKCGYTVGRHLSFFSKETPVQADLICENCHIPMDLVYTLNQPVKSNKYSKDNPYPPKDGK